MTGFGTGPPFFEWRCEICKRVRHNSKISVHKIPFKLQGESAERLVNHCNDVLSCATLAREVKLPEGVADEPQSDEVNT